MPVHLRRGGGEQRQPEYLRVNPQGLVPALEHHGEVLVQSLAILEWLEESYPQPALLPAEPFARARVRALALLIACDIHPLNNLRVLTYLQKVMSQAEEAVSAWYRHWVAEGFAGLEAQARASSASRRYLCGDHVSIADVCLVPQVYNAQRFGCDLTPYPTLTAVTAHLESLPEFVAARPEHQIDAE
jgi:maleylacetoacetate isomerase/maleylpyruvate isomerase